MDLNIQIHEEIHLLQDILQDFEVKQSSLIASKILYKNTGVLLLALSLVVTSKRRISYWMSTKRSGLIIIILLNYYYLHYKDTETED